MSLTRSTRQSAQSCGSTEGFHYFWQLTKDEPWKEVSENAVQALVESGRARYHTVLSTTFRDGDTGAKYRGPFYLDVDVKPEQGGIAVATQATIRLADKLAGLDVDLTQCRLFASGGKGYHIEVPSAIFRQGGEPAEGITELALIYRNMADEMYVDGLDMSIFSGRKGRQWRLPNVQRENGRFKVPITLDELKSMTPEVYESFTSSPRATVPIEPPTYSAKLAGEFMKAHETVAKIPSRKAQVEVVDPIELLTMSDTKQTIEIVKRASLARVGELVPEWLEGEWHGDFFPAKNPTRADRKGGSFIVYRNGSWIEMASDIGDDGKHEDRGSDLVSLYAYVFGAHSQEDAARKLALDHGIEIAQTLANLRTEVRVAEFDVQAKEGVSPESVRGGFVAESAASLLAQVFTPARAIVEGLLFEGVTILCGPPKVGKSFLALDIALSVAANVPTLGGRMVHGGPVLYLTPDDANRPRLQQRIFSIAAARHAERGLDKIAVVLDVPRVNEGFEDAFKRHIEEMAEHPALVVIDTLNKVMPLGGRQSNQYQHESNVMGAVKKLADDYGVALLVLHHDRKAESVDKLDGVSGTKAVTGGADAIWMMRRLTAATKAASLDVTGRDCEELSLGLTFNGDRLVWNDEGQTPEMLKAGESRQEVINLLRAQGAIGAGQRDVPGLTVKAIAEALDEKDNSVRKLLKRMAEDGILLERQDGKSTTFAIV